jgi:hypothetical protein
LAEQQSALLPHWLPSVWQPVVIPAVGTAAHLFIVQTVVQQSAPVAHASPSGLHAAAPHLPPLHTFEQQSGPVAQAAPAVAQAPPVTAQT